MSPEELAEALAEELERARMSDIDIDMLLGVAEADPAVEDLRAVLVRAIARLELRRLRRGEGA